MHSCSAQFMYHVSISDPIYLVMTQFVGVLCIALISLTSSSKLVFFEGHSVPRGRYIIPPKFHDINMLLYFLLMNPVWRRGTHKLTLKLQLQSYVMFSRFSSDHDIQISTTSQTQLCSHVSDHAYGVINLKLIGIISSR